MSAKGDTAAAVREAWPRTFTVQTILASFAGADKSPVDMVEGGERLNGRGSRRQARPCDRPPLADVPLLLNDTHITQSLGRQAKRHLRSAVHAITGLRISNFVFGSYTQEKERSARPVNVQDPQGVTKGRLFTHEQVVAKYEEAAKKREETKHQEGEESGGKDIDPRAEGSGRGGQPTTPTRWRQG